MFWSKEVEFDVVIVVGGMIVRFEIFCNGGMCWRSVVSGVV